MQFLWADYDNALYGEIDQWDPACLMQFAADEPLSKEWAYYQNSGEYIVGKNVFCKVVSDEAGIVAALILIRSLDGESLHINPIIVNPTRQGKGLVTAVVQELIDEARALFPFPLTEITADCDTENHRARRMLNRLGFVQTAIHEDGDFIYHSRFL